MTSPAKPGLHPLMAIAAVAVVLFCGVGTAAIMGWLPKSTANGDVPPPSAAQMSPQLAAAPVAQQLAQQAAQPAPAQPLAVNGATPVSDMPQAQPAPAVCQSCGVVTSVRTIEHRPQGSGLGAAGGAIVGGLLGNQVGGGHGRQLATVAGAVGGAVAGNQIESSMKTTHSWQVVVRMDNGSKRTFNQSSQPAWREGDSVRVVNGKLRALD